MRLGSSWFADALCAVPADVAVSGQPRTKQRRRLAEDKRKGMTNESGWRGVAAKYHDDLRGAVAKHKGQVLKTSEVAAIVRAVTSIGKDAQFVYPSDHCVNHTNDGACYCAMTDRALFERIRRGEFRVR